MSISNILGLRFLIRKDKAKDNLAPVFARITLDGKSADISLKRDIAISSWNEATKRTKGRTAEEEAFNNFLEQPAQCSQPCPIRS